MNKTPVSLLVATAASFSILSILVLSSVTPSTAAPSPMISVEPSYKSTTPWQTFTVNITVDPSGDEILGASYELHFNPRVLRVLSQTQGTFLSQGGVSTLVYENSWDNITGRVKYAEVRMAGNGVNTSGVLASITFETRYLAGNSTLTLENVILANESGEECPNIEINDGLIENQVTPSQFSIYGYVFYNNGSECNNPTIKIVNLNTSSEWTADTRPDSNYYRCNLTAGIDVSDDDILLFTTTSPGKEQVNSTYHRVTVEEINSSGIHYFNISLEHVRHDINISADYYPPSGIKIEDIATSTVIPPEEHLVTGNTYSIKYRVENYGNVDENVSMSVKVVNESWEGIINDYNVVIRPGEGFVGNESWTPLIHGNYTIIVNASVPGDEHPGDNERSRDVILRMPEIDISISEIKINPACTKVVNKASAFSNESNEICAIVWNNGTDDAPYFNVSFMIDDEVITSSVVGGLIAGSNVSVCTLWTPVQPGNYQLNVSADSDDDLGETNESNNVMLKSIGVYNNGYKGKRYTGGEDIKTVQIYEGNINVSYSLGDSYCLGNKFGLDSYLSWTRYVVNWTAEDLKIPADARVKDARLYVYYRADGTPDGNITNYFNLTFNSVAHPIAALYRDRGFGEAPCGMVLYNVTADFNADEENKAILRNEYGGYASMMGMVLLVIYEHADEPHRVIWINEGFDLLKADGDYCVSVEEATAYAPFEGALATKRSARLMTIAPQATDMDNTLYFNEGEWYGVWHTPPAPPEHPDGPPELGISDTDVSEYLHSCDNLAKIQSNSVNELAVSNAILVVEGDLSRGFDTGPGGYPSIPGVHNGTITPSHNISVSKVYIYPCEGTGGHIEYMKIWIEGTSWCRTATWDGYKGDYHNLSFDEPFILYVNVTYNYTIRTGSYPRIIHRSEYPAIGGEIKCNEFIDANGKRYTDWIPAIRLY